MRAGYISDIHLEMYRQTDDAVKFLEFLRPVETLDVLILAGDIGSLVNERMLRYLDQFKTWAINILFVPGNHCYYDTNPDIGAKDMLTKLQSQGLIVLGPGFSPSFSLDGIKFVGSTLWYPDNNIVRYRLKTWSDAAHIKNFIHWWEIHQANERKLLWDEMTEGCVVITHMLPTFDCVSSKFAGDPYNCLFVADVNDIIEQKKPKLWICGHSHDEIDRIIYPTHVVSNPIGYFHERSSNMAVKIINL